MVTNISSVRSSFDPPEKIGALQNFPVIACILHYTIPLSIVSDHPTWGQPTNPSFLLKQLTMTNPTQPDGKPAAKPTVGGRKPRQPTVAQQAAAMRQRSSASREAALVALGQWTAVEFGVTYFQQVYCAAQFVADCINPGGDTLDFLLPTEEMQLRKHNTKVLALETPRFSSDENNKVIDALSDIAKNNDANQVLTPKLVKSAFNKIMEQTKLALKAYRYLAFYYRAGPLSRQDVADQVRLRFEREDVENMKHLKSRIEAFGREQMQEFADQGGLDDDGMQDKVHQTRALKKRTDAAREPAGAAASPVARAASSDITSAGGGGPANLPECSVVTRTTRVTFFGLTQRTNEQGPGGTNHPIMEEPKASESPRQNATLHDEHDLNHDDFNEETQSSDESQDPNEIDDPDDDPFEIPLHAATARRPQVQYQLQLARRKRQKRAPPKPPRDAPSTNKKQRCRKGCSNNDYTDTNRNQLPGDGGSE